MYVQQWKIKNVYAYPLYFIIEFDNMIKIMNNNTRSILAILSQLYSKPNSLNDFYCKNNSFTFTKLSKI